MIGLVELSNATYWTTLSRSRLHIFHFTYRHAGLTLIVCSAMGFEIYSAEHTTYVRIGICFSDYVATSASLPMVCKLGKEASLGGV